jgi:hypothetical protein
VEIKYLQKSIINFYDRFGHKMAQQVEVPAGPLERFERGGGG